MMRKGTTELVLKDEVYTIVGAAVEVHRQLGAGFLEPVYQEAVGIELTIRTIPFEAQKKLHILYKGQQLQRTYLADFVCYDQIVVEIKALDRLTGREQSQIINYLKIAGMRVGLLINFGNSGKLEWKRYIV